MQNHSCLQIGGVSEERVKPEQVLRHCRVWLYALQLVWFRRDQDRTVRMKARE